MGSNVSPDGGSMRVEFEEVVKVGVGMLLVSGGMPRAVSHCCGSVERIVDCGGSVNTSVVVGDDKE